MSEIIKKLLEKNYDWAYIHTFLDIRSIGGIWLPNPLYDIEMQENGRKIEQKKLIEEALIEVDFLRHV